MLLYQKFGISREDVDPSDVVAMIQLYDKSITANNNLPWSLTGRASSLIIAAVRFYLLADFRNAADYGVRVTSAVIDYLFGNWRTLVKTNSGTIDPGWWHGVIYWMDEFSGALMWGSTFDQWQDLQTIAGYPDDRRASEPQDGAPAVRQYYIEIARFLRGEDIQGAVDRVNRVRGGNIRGTAALARALEAIAGRDEVAANEAINEFFARRHKRQRSRDITDTISMDGTTIVNIARRDRKWGHLELSAIGCNCYRLDIFLFGGPDPLAKPVLTAHCWPRKMKRGRNLYYCLGRWALLGTG